MATCGTWRSAGVVIQAVGSARGMSSKTGGKVSVALIKKLRERTGAPIKCVKEALEESEGDLEEALTHLRKVGAALAKKRMHREAGEGVIAMALDREYHRCGAVVELNCETDFVARTQEFVSIAKRLADVALETGMNGDRMQENEYVRLSNEFVLKDVENKTADCIAEASATLGEKIEIKRADVLHVSQENAGVFGYVHGVGSPEDSTRTTTTTTTTTTCGKLGILVALSGNDEKESNLLQNVGRRVAMHIAAANPSYRMIDDIPHKVLMKERHILTESSKTDMRARGKSIVDDDVLKRIVDGRLGKWFGDVVLDRQEMLVETPGYVGKSRSVRQSMTAEMPDAAVIDFVRYQVGGDE